MTCEQIKLSGVGWILPSGNGSGNEIFSRPEWLDWTAEDNAKLEGFSARPYLRSVKGYLDPAGAFFLAASTLALEFWPGDTPGGLYADAGICTVTQYGAPQSGYRFYEQFIQKGARFASPLLFPHGYPNTAGNLAAIELGFGGPHMVFYGTSNPGEAFDFALSRLQDGTARNMLVGVCEAVSPQALPDHLRVLNGAIAIWLSVEPEAPELVSGDRLSNFVKDVPAEGRGSVNAMLSLITKLECRIGDDRLHEVLV